MSTDGSVVTWWGQRGQLKVITSEEANRELEARKLAKLKQWKADSPLKALLHPGQDVFYKIIHLAVMQSPFSILVPTTNKDFLYAFHECLPTLRSMRSVWWIGQLPIDLPALTPLAPDAFSTIAQQRGLSQDQLFHRFAHGAGLTDVGVFNATSHEWLTNFSFAIAMKGLGLDAHYPSANEDQLHELGHPREEPMGTCKWFKLAIAHHLLPEVRTAASQTSGPSVWRAFGARTLPRDPVSAQLAPELQQEGL